jgi:hypothetical protein
MPLAPHTGFTEALATKAASMGLDHDAIRIATRTGVFQALDSHVGTIEATKVDHPDRADAVAATKAATLAEIRKLADGIALASATAESLHAYAAALCL